MNEKLNQRGRFCSILQGTRFQIQVQTGECNNHKPTDRCATNRMSTTTFFPVNAAFSKSCAGLCNMCVGATVILEFILLMYLSVAYLFSTVDPTISFFLCLLEIFGLSNYPWLQLMTVNGLSHFTCSHKLHKSKYRCCT